MATGIMTDINKVKLVGVVKDVYSNRRITLMTVSTMNLRMRRDPVTGRPQKDLPIVAFFDKEGMDVASRFHRGDHVTVEAVIQNTYNHMQLSGRQECWGISVKPTPSVEEGLSGVSGKGHIFPDDVNEVMLRGKVSAVHASGAWVRLSVKTAVDAGDGKYRSTSFCRYRAGDGAAFAKGVPVGSTVTVIGRVITGERKSKKDKERNEKYTDVIAREVIVENVARGGEAEQEPDESRTTTMPGFT